MATLSGGVRNWPAMPCVVMLLLSAALAATAGCQARSTAYRYGNLPAGYEASPVATAETIDLSRLSTSTVDSNLIDIGDLLEVSISTPVDEEAPEPAYARVDENGMLSVPPVGEVAVAGLSAQQAEAEIASMGIQRKMYVVRPNVTVKIEDKKVNRIQMVGELGEPGEVALRQGNSNLLAGKQ